MRKGSLKQSRERNPSEIANIAKELYQCVKDNADRRWFGQGRETGSVTLHFLKGGRTIAPFTLYKDGHLSINFGYLFGALSQDTLEQFYAKLMKIPAMNHFHKVFTNKYVSKY